MKKNSGAYKTQKIYTSLAADTLWPTVSTRETNTRDAQSPVMTIFVRNIPAGRLRGGRFKADEQRENMAELEANGYRYILSAKIKNEIRMIRKWIPAQPEADKWMEEYDKGEERRLFVGNKNHARKETRNKENGISRQEKTY